MFINRDVEREQLERLYLSGHAELYVLYGRRRVGKTELLRIFCEGKPHLFFIATLSSDQEQLASFSRQIWAYTHPERTEGFLFPTWEAAFLALADLPGRPIVVLDEFTYLINGNRAIPSILQKAWDQQLRQSQVMLILCGSYVGIMETEVLGYQAPLYGRRTGSFFLQPLDLPSSAMFFPKYSQQEQFLAWAVVGGMPYYLSAFSDDRSVLANIRQQILDAGTGILFGEPRLLLMEELREPRSYFSILRAIAQGRTRLFEIAQASGVGQASTVARYLDILQQMRVIVRRTPATESLPEKSKKGLYQISDHFLRFWFRYVHPYQGELELGLADAILAQRVQPDLDAFAALSFEEAAQAFLARLARAGRLPFLPQRIGAWWDRLNEIDVVAIHEGERVLGVGECKWSIHPVGMNVLESLREKTKSLLRDEDGWMIHYYLFARSGFTPELEAHAKEEGVHLIGLEEMLQGF